MANETQDGQEKTEQPSDRRRDEYRAEGQIARSVEVTAFFGILAAFGACAMWGRMIGQTCLDALRGALFFDHGVSLALAEPWWRQFAIPMIKAVLSIGATVFLVVLAGSWMQTGIVFAWKSLRTKWEMVNPFSGLKRMFSSRTAVQLLKNLLKVGVITWLVYGELSQRTEEIAAITMIPMTSALLWSVALVARLLFRIIIFLAIVAVLDFGYQWWTMRKQMMMSRQELKEEVKQQQVSEQVRGKLRSVASQRVKHMIKQEVPAADVVITNPTHFAVAVKYERGSDRAPRVVAKGKDLVAAYIREVAAEAHVPLYEFPELARTLYARVKVGQSIPGDLYEAVARVLAYIYQIYRRRFAKWMV
ncbi:MAG: EscU/YscU/HrcU family type III secretion system export apparatus switch protein [Deltaproteobacteria bacterium]|nr:EscU/YscU/HrcU family type III secretion system export apparatus switch protein [Deltaproteobacteria bacterium]